MSAQVNRKVELPERLEELMDSPEAMVKVFQQKEEERNKARIAKRVERFKEKVGDKNSKEHQVLLRQILIQDLKSQIAELRDAKKDLQKEIKVLRGSKTRNRKKEEAKAATK